MGPQFHVVGLGNGQYTINESGRTIAIITSQGFIDWLIFEPDQPGELIAKLYKETHLSYTLGLKFQLNTLTPATKLKRFTYEIDKAGEQVHLHAYCESVDGAFGSNTDARLFLAEDGRYRWVLETAIQNRSDEAKDVPRIEYNNVYPAKAGRCMLFAPTKEYNGTLITDKHGIVWRFPHQHQLHYSTKLEALSFSVGTSGGFAGEPAGNPTVEVTQSTNEPFWAICDMYYDLHCQARLTEPIEPGASIRFGYTIRYLSPSESTALDSKSKPIPIGAEDWESHNYPRLELGMNRFSQRCDIDRMDDCSAFKPHPPLKVWDREVGHAARGSLRITHDAPTETVWGQEPPTQIPAGTTLGITGKVKTANVTGKGAYLRVRYFTFDWHPQPHVEWVRDLESVPITGTTDGWVQVTVPSLRVENAEVDYLVQLEVILDGEGIAWFTDVDVDLVTSVTLDPVLNVTKPLVTV